MLQVHDPGIDTRTRGNASVSTYTIDWLPSNAPYFDNYHHSTTTASTTTVIKLFYSSSPPNDIDSLKGYLGN
jgi:hypothetical protein